MKAEVYEAFRAINVPEDKALKAAEALSRRDADVEDLKSDVRLLKWMAGTNAALTLIVLGTVFTVLVRLGEIAGQVTQLAQRLH
jgi:hypothetical protein